MSASETLAFVFLAGLRRFAGETPLSARITPMQWVALAKELGLSESARSEAINSLRTKGYILYKPETTEIIALSLPGIEMADLQIRKRPKVSDPFPDKLAAICEELDYWELHLNDGDPGSIHWDQVQARIEGLRHRENRYRQTSSVIYNAVGTNAHISQISVDQSANLVLEGGAAESSLPHGDSEAALQEGEPTTQVSLRNFHVDSNLTDADMLRRSDGFLKNLVASFRQAAANGCFTFGPVKLQDADLNRVHGIVTEIDARRLFYACSDDEVPRYAMESLYEARRAIREASKGVWANPSCEVLVQEITATLADFCTKGEKRINDDREFYNLMTGMRLKVWLLVAMLKKKLGSVLNPRNLPAAIWLSVRDEEI